VRGLRAIMCLLAWVVHFNEPDLGLAARRIERGEGEHGDMASQWCPFFGKEKEKNNCRRLLSVSLVLHRGLLIVTPSIPNYRLFKFFNFLYNFLLRIWVYATSKYIE
jgi:hypothetical protein